MITCPSCSAQMPNGTKFCTNCGKELIAQNTCPKCGAPIVENAAFCTKCGYSIRPPKQVPNNRPERDSPIRNVNSPSHAPKTETERFFQTMFIILTVVGIMGVGYGAFSYYNPEISTHVQLERKSSHNSYPESTPDEWQQYRITYRDACHWFYGSCQYDAFDGNIYSTTWDNCREADAVSEYRSKVGLFICLMAGGTVLFLVLAIVLQGVINRRT